jgi:hypothetical protein
MRHPTCGDPGLRGDRFKGLSIGNEVNMYEHLFMFLDVKFT